MITCNTCGFKKTDNERCECPVCRSNDWIDEDILILKRISNDDTFIDAMLQLKSNDIIEYNLKLSQFKNQLNQQESTKIQQKQAEESKKPHCPHCKSTNISSIGTGERVGSIAVWGIFSKKINKSFKCKSCGYTW